jgi:hypothetical protein
MLDTVVEYKNRNHTIFALVKYQVMIGTAIKHVIQELLNRWGSSWRATRIYLLSSSLFR